MLENSPEACLQLTPSRDAAHRMGLRTDRARSHRGQWLRSIIREKSQYKHRQPFLDAMAAHFSSGQLTHSLFSCDCRIISFAEFYSIAVTSMCLSTLADCTHQRKCWLRNPSSRSFSFDCTPLIHLKWCTSSTVTANAIINPTSHPSAARGLSGCASRSRA